MAGMAWTVMAKPAPGRMVAGQRLRDGEVIWTMDVILREERLEIVLSRAADAPKPSVWAVRTTRAVSINAGVAQVQWSECLRAKRLVAAFRNVT